MMIEIVISDIDDSIGPGDIVGAFINEAGINSGDIGKIDIKNYKAEVEVDDEVAKQVVDSMDNNQIGGVSVKVYPKNPEDLLDEGLREYIEKYRRLVELERTEEMERHELEIKRLSPREREKKGRAVLNLRGRGQGKAFGNKPIVKFMRVKKGEKLPDTEISIGDLVMISKKWPLADDNPTGTVAEKTNYSITVVFDEKPPSFVFDKGLRMDLYVNDITFQRMLDSLDSLKTAEGRLEELRGKLLGEEKLNWIEKEVECDWVNEDLNQSQKTAVKKSLKAKDFYLIQGPPGTGKTMTAIEIINQAVKNDKDILATADSNTAVDNLVERLADSGLEVVRVGHPIRVTPLLREHTLDYQVLEHEDYVKAQQIREEAFELKEEQDKYIHPGGSMRRGMSDEQIKENARKNRGSRGINPQQMEKMAKWLELQDKIDDYFTKVDELENKAINELINQADVVCATNSTSGSELMAEKEFDLVVIDEATQSTEPGALIPIVRSNKAILIGDHKQLPPTVLNQKAADAGLKKSLFERLYEIHGDELWSLLQIQYRMHDKIMNFSNHKFYSGRLVSDESVADHTLRDLGVESEKNRCFTDKALIPDKPIVFIDTSNMEAEERSLSSSNSYDNPVEAEIVLDLVDEAQKLGVDGEDIAVITPYKDQVDLLNHRCKSEKIEINTVDGFQGREKELIVLSLVRSNKRDNIGFLRDLRRMNVSLTRAKRKLIIIGDKDTISSHRLYEDLVNYVKENGLYYSL
ncbi:MAG: IGHMBP2 family helicase [Bacillota bacterium]